MQMGIQWLLKNHRDLIDAEFALNEGGGVGLKNGKPLANSVQTSEKVSLSYQLEVKNPGGHSSLPSKDNAIYRLADGLARLARFDFPVQLNETTRAYFQRTAALEDAQVGGDMRSLVSATARSAGRSPRLSNTIRLQRAAAHDLRHDDARGRARRQRAAADRARHRELPHAARASRSKKFRRRWFACSPTTRSPSRRPAPRCSARRRR